jgi:four helix bundle protein
MDFHDDLKIVMHRFVRYVYRVTRNYPKEELYGITSQIRRSALSIILNYIEGFARRTGEDCKTYRYFLNIAYGSAKESKYLLFLSFEEGLISSADYERGLELADKIVKMLWKIK